jgi:hypothetical protein
MYRNLHEQIEIAGIHNFELPVIGQVICERRHGPVLD